VASSSPVRHAWRVLLGLLLVTGVLFGINSLGVYVFTDSNGDPASSWTPELLFRLKRCTPDAFCVLHQAENLCSFARPKDALLLAVADRSPGCRHCTFAVTAAVPASVHVHVFRLLPPLEHAPDQIASRPLLTLKVIDVPVLNGADPVLPDTTLMPAGLEVTRSPLRPLTVTESVTA